MMSFAPWSRPRRAPEGDDVALLGRVAAGDAQALDQLYRREAGPVYRYVLALCGNEAWAADATQEAFVVLATRSAGFDAARGSLGAWLAGVARHALAARWREGRLESPWPEDDEAVLGADPVSPESALVQVQDLSELWAALRALPAPFREALVLVDLQERPYAEAARIAGIEINTLRTRLHRARAKLAARLGAADGSPR
ncbi:MAG: RNA polymerase sigma factor [Rubrivivax sp.]|nr:RNA polymerase sigma factor [Rubrivivax sp.]